MAKIYRKLYSSTVTVYSIEVSDEILEEYMENFDVFKKELDRLCDNKIWKIKINELQNIYETDLHIENNKNPINILFNFILIFIC
mgnify:CR=1 FL=1